MAFKMNILSISHSNCNIIFDLCKLKTMGLGSVDFFRCENMVKKYQRAGPHDLPFTHPLS